MIISNRFLALASPVTGIAALALAAGTATAWYYAARGLTLSHYDAKAHLVVARRIADSITPGWEQIGAVWLPLPHLVNALPVQIDLFYRTGLFAVGISVVSLAVAAGATGALILQLTGSRAGAWTGAMLLAGNPNVLYLQSTPMTEPLLLALNALAVTLLARWVADGGRGPARPAGLAFAAACWTRYEAWAVTGAALGLAALVLWRRGSTVTGGLATVARVARYPMAAVALFLLLSRATVGEWFVSSGFFVADNIARGRPDLVLRQLVWGTHALSGITLVAAAIAALAALLVSRIRDERRTMALLALAFVAAGALPFVAYLQGHPFRIRYMVPLIGAAATLAGIGVGLLPRLRALAGCALVSAALLESPPIDGRAAMVAEAQWDVPRSLARKNVTACLVGEHDGTKVLMSMGSLAHYMQELSQEGFYLRDFIHEGNGALWNEAMVRPDRHARWVIVEERAEGGDVLAARARRDPRFLQAYERACADGGIALYRRLGPDRRP